ncbi:Potassium uptake protein TrkH [Winogradskyella psychrotolerans RS-3]|uniref:Potassium uptake protein TrkH n=1 Tax=Winogradskyella psychrotolerans RS-3 TaxID=641526 RepID=S7VKT1_9FLAO|nr:Potassium uptake protein TrkH [Winogradskyella psychrotolerans RS-3]
MSDGCWLLVVGCWLLVVGCWDTNTNLFYNRGKLQNKYN